MNPPAIAAWLDSYRQRLRPALQHAAVDGFRLLHANTVNTELSPHELSHTGRRHLRRHLEQLGVRIDALSAEFPGYGLADPEDADRRLAHLRETIALCRDLGITRVGTRIRGFTNESADNLPAEMVNIAADMADRFGIDLSIQTSDDEIPQAAKLLKQVDCPSLGIAADSSLSVENPEIAQNIHTIYLRDIRRRGQSVEEVEYGTGDVDFRMLLATLDGTEAPVARVIRQNSLALPVDVMRQGREYIGTLGGRITPT